MSIIDELKEILLESAFKRRDAIMAARNLVDTIEKHFVLQFVLNSDINVSKWREEVVHTVYRIWKKTKIKQGRQLKKKEYFSLLYNEPFEPVPEREVEVLIKQLIYQGYEFPPLQASDFKKIASSYKHFVEKISELLSKEEIDFDEIYDALQ